MALDKYNVTTIQTHVLDALNRLLMQYAQNIDYVYDNFGNVVVDNNGDPVINTPLLPLASRVYIFSQRMQMLESIFFALYTQTSLQNAIGITLDRWGVLLRFQRGGLGDDAYRDLLFLIIIEYTSKGQIETLIQIYKKLTGATQVILTEFFPAKIQLTAIGAIPIVPIASIDDVIQATKAGGVGFKNVLASSNPFVFAGDPSGQGFGGVTAGYVNQGVGGEFAGALS